MHGRYNNLRTSTHVYDRTCFIRTVWHMNTVLQYRPIPVKGKSLKRLARTMRQRYRTGTRTHTSMGKHKRNLLSKQYSNLLFHIALRRQLLRLIKKHKSTIRLTTGNYDHAYQMMNHVDYIIYNNISIRLIIN